jgi:putative transposase
MTLRAARSLPSLRRPNVFGAVRDALAMASGQAFRVVHFSVQADHVHLLVEADDRHALSHGARGVAIRVARAVNRVLGREGRVWADRYHARPLATPREVRHGLVYVLTNWKKHVHGARGFDPCASVYWFDGWKRAPTNREAPGWSHQYEPPVVAPRTWLLAHGWRRHGLLDDGERPSS